MDFWSRARAYIEDWLRKGVPLSREDAQMDIRQFYLDVSNYIPVKVQAS